MKKEVEFNPELSKIITVNINDEMKKSFLKAKKTSETRL